MKYAVIGLGVVGSIVGGLLAKSGEDVILIGKQHQIEVINQKGIKIEGINGTIIVKNIQASASLSSVKDVDIVFVCLKSQDTKELANNLRKHIGKSALIVSLQNGVRNTKALRDATGNKVLSGIILFNALYSEPGEVTLALKGGLLLENDTKNKDVLLSLLNNAGLKTKVVDGIEGFLWSKLILNLQIAVTALTGQTIKESIVNKDSRKILVATMKEGVEIVEKSGITLEPLPEIDPRRIMRRLNRFDSMMLCIGSRFMGLKENARNSMWQSLSRGKQTEIDYINGEIVHLAEQNNLKAPINTKLIELVKEAERKHSTKSFAPSELKDLLGI